MEIFPDLSSISTFVLIPKQCSVTSITNNGCTDNRQHQLILGYGNKSYGVSPFVLHQISVSADDNRLV